MDVFFEFMRVLQRKSAVFKHVFGPWAASLAIPLASRPYGPEPHGPTAPSPYALDGSHPRPRQAFALLFIWQVWALGGSRKTHLKDVRIWTGCGRAYGWI